MFKHPSLSPLEANLSYLLRFISVCVSQSLAAQLEATGVTLTEFLLMRDLYDKIAATPSQLVKRLGLSKGAVSKIISSLEQKELAQSEKMSVRRYQVIRLTHKGKKLVPHLVKLLNEHDRQLFGHLSKTQRNNLNNQLTNLVDRHGWKIGAPPGDRYPKGYRDR